MTEAAVPSPYPVRLDVDYPEEQSRWKALLRLPLSVPLLLVLAALQFAAAFATLAMWAMILSRGRVPRWLFDFQLAVNRWSFRALGYVFLLSDEYAPFGEEAAIRYEVDYPERVSRWRLVIVKLVTAFPHLLILDLLLVPLSIGVLIGWFAILITGTYHPRELQDFAASVLRWFARVQAYILSLTDAFPPFSWSANAATAGRTAYLISSVAGVPLSLLFGVCAAAAFVPQPAETAGVSYERLLGGDLRPGEARLEVNARDVDWIDPAPSGTVELTSAVDPATGLGSLFPRTPHHRFVQFDLVLENETYGTVRLDTLDFSLEDLDGDRQQPVLVLIDGRIPPRKVGFGESASVAIVFELPDTSDPAELRFHLGDPVDRNVVYTFD